MSNKPTAAIYCELCSTGTVNGPMLMIEIFKRNMYICPDCKATIEIADEIEVINGEIEQ